LKATPLDNELFFSEVLPDRPGNLEEDAIVIIMQRLHERDVSGVALDREMGYTHVSIPMEYEPRLYVNAFTVNYQGNDVIKTFFDDQAAAIPEENIFWRDWRTEDGELAWPERFPPHVVEVASADGIGAAIASYRAALSDPARQGRIQYAPCFAPYTFALFSDVLCRTGNHDGGSEALMGAAVIAEQSGACWWDAEICRLRGLVALSGGEVWESEAWLLKSLQTAQRQRAKSLELRAATSMARLWRDQSKRQQAHDLLGPVYGWFTEGFDTLDLKEAKVLLDQLT